MKKIFLFVALLAGMGMFATVPADKARAGLDDYVIYWTAKNFYDSQNLVVGFSGLDVSTAYRWTVQLVDIKSNQPFADIGKYTHTPGATTDAFQMGPETTTLVAHLGDWPFQYTGPFRIQDSYGQIVMRGFIAPDPDLYVPGDWKSGGGNNAYIDKVVIGSPTHVLPVQNAVYNPISVDGWHYDQRNPASNSVDTTEIAIMHFNLDCATYIGAGYTTESYAIYAFDGTLIDRFAFNDLIDDQERELIWPPGGCGAANDQVFEAFVPLNITGEELEWNDNARSDRIYAATYGNPYRTSFAPGAYYVQKRSAADAWVADGEAPFLVSNGDKGVEWKIQIGATNVRVSGNQTITYRANTPEIWDDYHGATLCQNDQMTWSDSTTYTFVTSRTETRPVPATEVNGDFIECAILPTAIGTSLMTVSEATVVIESELYNTIPGPPTIEDLTNDFLAGLKLNTENGQNIAFAVVMAISLAVVGMTPARKSKMSFLIVWTGIGGIWAAWGPSTTIGQVMFIVITVVLWIWTLNQNDNNESSQSY